MKKLISFILLATVSVGQSLGQSLYNEDNNYGFGPGFLAKEALYDIIRTIEQPSAVPSFEDSLSYFEGLRIRREDSLRAETAAKDAVWSIEAISTWSEAVGVELSAENTPILWGLISRAIQDGDNLICALKGKYFKERPYSYFNETPDGFQIEIDCVIRLHSRAGIAVFLALYPQSWLSFFPRGRRSSLKGGTNSARVAGF